MMNSVARQLQLLSPGLLAGLNSRQLSGYLASSSSGSTSSTGSGKSFSTAGDAAPPPQNLTPEQVQHLNTFLNKIKKPGQTAAKAAALASLAGNYRDIYLSLDSLQKRLAGASNPLLQDRPTASADKQLPTTFPILDVTKLPDNVFPQGQKIDSQYMDKITCWQQVQPNHVETSNMLLTGVNLFPPQEATYPTYVDFQLATRLLDKHTSRKRMSLYKRLKHRQDKYQLKTWDHHKGE